MTGFRVDTTSLQKKIAQTRGQLRAERFKPDVLEFARKSLATAARLTPVRELSVIRENQVGKKNSQWAKWKAKGGHGINKREWLAARAPARFLYRASWGQLARSLGLWNNESASVLSVMTRRNPEEDPPKAYGQLRGGQVKLSVVMWNPFLEIPSMYKPFTGKEIIAEAMKKHQSQFQRKVDSRLKVILWAIFNKA